MTAMGTQPLQAVPAGINPAAQSYFQPRAGKPFLAAALASLGTSSPGAGNMRIYPVFFPYSVPVVSVGINVTTAGAAGSTLIPCAYGCDANGNPGSLLWQGPSLAADAVAFASAPLALTLAQGWAWLGAVHLSAGASCSVTGIARPGVDPRGSMAQLDVAGATASLGFQSGLSAPPAVYGGTLNAGSAVALYFGT